MKLLENSKMDVELLKNLDKKKETNIQQDDEYLERMNGVNGSHDNHDNLNFNKNHNTNED